MWEKSLHLPMKSTKCLLARLDRDEDVGIESYGLFCNMDEFFSAQIYADNEEHCFKVVAVQSVV